ncbi:MAG: response regulator transcription factor, partial [Rubrobacteraceae bacterium]
LNRDVHAAFAGSMLEVLGASDRVRPVEVPTTGETLTSREVEVLRLVAEGATNRDIAGRLFVSERTVKSHMTSILRKVGVSSRTQAAARARELRLI